MPSQLKGGYSKQRRHPGMMSSQDHATAHYGAVTGLKATEDGMYLLSAGSNALCLREQLVIVYCSTGRKCVLDARKVSG